MINIITAVKKKKYKIMKIKIKQRHIHFKKIIIIFKKIKMTKLT